MIETKRLRIRRAGEPCSHKRLGSGHAYLLTNLANLVEYKFFPSNARTSSQLPNGWIKVHERYLRDCR